MANHVPGFGVKCSVKHNEEVSPIENTCENTKVTSPYSSYKPIPQSRVTHVEDAGDMSTLCFIRNFVFYDTIVK